MYKCLYALTGKVVRAEKQSSTRKKKGGVMPVGKAGNRLPGTVRNHIGAGKIEKGSWVENAENKFYLLAWDFAIPCTYETCPLYQKCTYVTQWMMRKDELGEPGRTDQCRMQQRYIKSIIYSFVEKMTNAKKTEQENVIKLGFHLIPLYSQLFKFKMHEYGNKEIVMWTSRGDSKINPVYKEIREIIKTITSVWKDIGSSVKMKANPTTIGDTAFIDAMYSVSEVDDEVSEVSDDEDIGEVDEEVDEKGSGVDFGEEEVEADEKGTGIDIDKYNVADECTKVKERNYSYIERTDKTTPIKRKKKKRKKKPRLKKKVEVLSYTDPRRIEMRKKEREAAKKAKESEEIKETEETVPSKRKRKRK